MPANALRQPIPGSDPGGIDLSFLAEFDAIVDARRGDDPSLDQGEWTRELKTADWPRVARLSYDALSERSKDLRIAGWYLEARTQADGLQGFAEGYEVLAALCEEHWSDMHPRAEDDEERLGCLQWIATQSPRWLRGVPLLGKGSESLDTLPSFAERHPEIKLDGAGTVATWRRSMPDEPLHAASASVRAALLAIDALDGVVDTQTGSQGPSFSGVRDVLGHVLAALAIPAAAMNYPSDSLRSNDDLPDCSAGFNDSGKRSPPPSMPASHQNACDDAPWITQTITDRKSALRALRDIAHFFRQTEPHSPVAYLADKAARWGNMPLHEWLGQVLGDGEALGRMRDLLDVADEGASR